MKSVLVVLAVLVAASFANAGYVLNGTPTGPAASFTLSVSTTGGEAQGFWMLVADASNGAISGGALGLNSDKDFSGIDASTVQGEGGIASYGVAVPAGFDGKWGSIAAIGAITAGEQLKDFTFTFANSSIKNAVVSFYTVADAEGLPTTMQSQITLTNVPEPMTMTLLGLGGLFFARRKN